MKRFSDSPETSKRVDFEVDFWNGDRSESHQFAANPKADAFALATISKLAGNERTAIDALTRVKNYIRTMLDDTDGTPLEWEPVVLPNAMAVPHGDLSFWPQDVDTEPVEDNGRMSIVGGLDDEEEPEPQFLAPDGTVHPMRDAAKYLDPGAASSRRRWVELMDGDNDLTVKANTIMKLWQWLVSESAGRPTVR